MSSGPHPGTRAPRRILVAGGGPAAHRLAECLHAYGHPGPVTLLDAAPEPVHHRPLLTSLLTGELPPAALRLPPPPGAEVHRATEVTGIDRARREVRAVRNGTVSRHPYDVLVLATGARPVIPPLPGTTGPDGRLAPGVTALRTPADLRRITGATAVVLGGGPLGVETAVALARRSTATTLLCAGPHPLHRRLDDLGGALLTARLERAGVTVRAGRTAVRRTPGRVLLDDGSALPAATLVLCTGAEPEVRTARAAGLPVRTGIVVDDALRTGDPRVYAIGDCAEHAGRAVAGYESARAQAESLAAILTGRATVHRPPPYVFRPRTPAVDLCCVGPPAAFADPGVRTVTLHDRAGERYGRLAVREDRIAAAVLLGLPEAIAAVTQLHRYGRPVPSDRLALLLGVASAPPSTAAGPDENAVICLCNSVPLRKLAGAWRDGARTVDALADATRATTGCGDCAARIAGLCADWAREAAAPGTSPGPGAGGAAPSGTGEAAGSGAVPSGDAEPGAASPAPNREPVR
ncbi:FAD-dependent oxidoreductase [Streptomyces sp. LP05-1]|uniref:FAD-dependent oxidoreductase n=1 Tax=Streptomyces pyxinae TaxID=2970734 RepID=A0ABT2CQQ0_9ACTN|nr:FAD-dependent oxidoreductase [Streptomyces sp. LP05-1]MCS0639770.1 FAD-dependent oxidoreductase [Streptomyces sp. LP05-1]